MFAGDISNNYVLAEMKVWTNGHYSWARLVTSTLCGQMVNTAVFYIFGLWKLIPTHALTKSIVIASLTKVGVEFFLLPATLKVSLWLKRMKSALLDTYRGPARAQVLRKVLQGESIQENRPK
jgi:uncharacterized PurR-regulated membrane protein YhhQ (DUF165 family)